MRPSTYISLRYLFSRKEKTVINLISWISLAGIAVSTLALVVVMSVYNGIGELTQTLFNVFDPELIIESDKGKTFSTDNIDYQALKAIDNVAVVSEIVEENAWLTLHQSEAIVQLRGVDANYHLGCGLDTMLTDGQYILKETTEYGNRNYLLFGWNIMMRMGVNSMTNTPVAVHIPKRGTTSLGFSIDEAFNNGYAVPAGAFSIQEEIDNMYVVADIDFVRDLMSYDSCEVTSLAVSFNDHSSRAIRSSKKQIQSLLGDNFTVKDRYEQKPLYYKIFRSERLGVFLILSLIVLISTLNLIASLSLLIINKRKDISTLKAIGMERKEIQRVFFSEGVLIALVGCVGGLLLGFVVCVLQQHLGIVKLGANAVVDAFPVSMRVVDFVATFIVVTLLSSLVVTFTVKRAKI